LQPPCRYRPGRVGWTKGQTTKPADRPRIYYSDLGFFTTCNPDCLCADSLGPLFNYLTGSAAVAARGGASGKGRKLGVVI